MQEQLVPLPLSFFIFLRETLSAPSVKNTPPFARIPLANGGFLLHFIWNRFPQTGTFFRNPNNNCRQHCQLDDFFIYTRSSETHLLIC